MSSGSEPIVAAESRPITLRMRPDLKIERNFYQGQSSWIVKDPLALKYFRLADEEFAALEMLNGETSLAKIKSELERRFPPWIVEYAELQSLLGMLHRYGLVLSDTDGQGEQLFERRRKQRLRQLGGKFASILWIRLPGMDPERFLNWLHPKFKWCFSRWCVLGCFTMALLALLLVFMHLDEFYRKLPAFHQFFGPANAFWLIIALIVSKILHELGHGLSCKHFGGECHEIGVMFLVFMPCMYCDTSDSWMLGNKWHRAAIGAAGMYVEIVLATICTFIWWNSEPGLVHYICLSTMFVCSVSTLLFNSNPLLRFDGYYILSDILEVPNLAQKSRSALVGFLRKWCLGMPWQDQFSLPPRRRLLFAIYAVSAVVYRWMVLLGILWFLSKVFEPYGLQALGHLLITFSLASLIVMPAWQLYRFFSVPGRMRQVKRARLAATVAFVLGVVLSIAYIPVPHWVMTSLVIRPQNAEYIYVQVPGVLVDVQVEPGDLVSANQLIATLENSEIDYQVEGLSGRVEQLRQQLKNLYEMQGYRDVSSQIPTTETSLRHMEQQFQKLRDEQARLRLICTRSGYVLPPAQQPAPATGDQALSRWSGSPLNKINLHGFLEKGTTFCLIGDPQKMEAVLVIDQTDMSFVRVGQVVEIKLDEFPYKTFSGKINEISRRKMAQAPPELSNKAQGDLATETDEAGGERPMSASFQAKVPLDGVDVRLLNGFRGRAKIHTASRTLGQILWRNVLETFRFG